ncbi:HAD family hydrolase [Geoalkalibacter halelectricus]|uniref:HAD family hydrolase n=1 Tax=Geoalkalibacter halelectricus TaxID=2847045 RepID=UPI003D1BEE2F
MLATIMIKAIFWDNDGVLVDTEPLYFSATRAVLAEAGVALSREAFIRISLEEGRSVFDLARNQGAAPDDLERLRRLRNHRYGELLASGMAALPGVEETLRALHGHCLMAIVTSSLREHFDIIHRHTGILKYFDFILTREDYQHTKPHPEPYLTALARSGLAPRQCLVVEDTRRGLRSAVEAGLGCAVIPNGLTHASDFSEARHVLSDVRQVAALLD